MKRCKFCGEFVENKSKHKCKRKKVKAHKFKCGDCKKYLYKRYFQKDKSRKYGIRYNCKKCRAKKGNGN
jgi:hypothetical protein